MKLTEPAFVWIEKGPSSQSPCKPFFGPHYCNWIEIIGKSYYHSLEDLLKIPKEAIKKKLSSAKEGTLIKIHNISSMRDIYLKRLTSEEIETINRSNAAKKQLKEVENEIQSHIPLSLLNKKRDLLKLCLPEKPSFLFE